MKKFSDFAQNEELLKGEKIKINEVIGKELIINNFQINGSKFEGKKCLTLQIKLNNEDRVIFTGSEVLMKQCEKYKEMMPFVATIKKIDKFYCFK